MAALGGGACGAAGAMYAPNILSDLGPKAGIPAGGGINSGTGGTAGIEAALGFRILA